MCAYSQMSRLAESLFPGSFSPEFHTAGVVEDLTRWGEQQLRAQLGFHSEALSEEAWDTLRRSLAMTLAWMRVFSLSADRLQALVDAWVRQQCEMVQRLAEDRGEIEALFGHDAQRIFSLDLDLSDRHSGGHSVAIFTFESGLKLVYKPRDLGIERWFAGFQASLNGMGAPQPFRVLGIIAREGYGWSEFAAHKRCASEGELQLFYCNAGALLCLLHLLCATDCHFENLIACGESPVFVDAETLLQPSLSPAADVASVLRTGMLPRPAGLLASATTPAADFGALSALTPQSVTISIPGLNEAPDHEATVTLSPETNLPFPPGHELNPQAYAEEMIAGFCQTWQFIAQHRDAILEMVKTASSERIRYVFRDTQSYYHSLAAALSSGDIDSLALPPLTGAKAVFAPLEPRELQSLRQLDIPRFTMSTADTGLEAVSGCFPVSGIEMARQTVANMSGEEMEKQAGILRVCWGLYGAAKAMAQLSKP
jgi:type 2 lantibiotic biosynthesis protein LanM